MSATPPMEPYITRMATPHPPHDVHQVQLVRSVMSSSQVSQFQLKPGLVPSLLWHTHPYRADLSGIAAPTRKGCL